MEYNEIVKNLSQNYPVLNKITEDDIIILIENQDNVLNYLKTLSNEEIYRFMLNVMDFMPLEPETENDHMVKSLIINLLSNKYFHPFQQPLNDYLSGDVDRLAQITDTGLLKVINEIEEIQDINELIFKIKREPTEEEKIYHEMLEKFFEQTLTPEDMEHYKTTIPDSADLLDEYTRFNELFDENKKNKPIRVPDQNIINMIDKLFEHKADQNEILILMEKFPKFKNIIENYYAKIY